MQGGGAKYSLFSGAAALCAKYGKVKGRCNSTPCKQDRGAGGGGGAEDVTPESAVKGPCMHACMQLRQVRRIQESGRYAGQPTSCLIYGQLSANTRSSALTTKSRVLQLS